MIGILPTLRREHLTHEALSANPRYALMNEQIFAARGEDLHIDIDGPERLSTYADTIAPEAACTSVQFHLQVSPQQYAATWNAAQCLAGVQLALGANSPFLFGKELWRETRIALFEQATDTRPEELKAQGVRPRVWFGERWITSIFDQFEENVRYFPALLPICDDEDPVQVLDRGDTPTLSELRMHNGTVYRWNRPVYDVSAASRTCASRTACCPPARRSSTCWPTARSTTGCCVLWPSRTGRCGRRCRSRRPRTTSHRRAARHRRAPLLAGPGRGAGHRTGAAPAAADGPPGPGRVGRRRSESRPAARRHRGALHHAAERRRVAGQHVPPHRRRGGRSTAGTALREMLRRYIEHMHTNEPVHTWPLD